jgi:hypothetical protein
MLALMKRWERDDPRVRVLEPWGAFVDDTTSLGPIGGAAGAAGAYTMEGLHPGPLGARVLAAIYDKALTDIGVRRTDYRGVSQADAYNAATNPYGNLVGARGAMDGTAGTLGTNASGVVATGWTLQTNNAELTVVGSKDTIVVTDDRGQTISHAAQKMVITAANTLTGERRVDFMTSSGGWASPAAAHELIVSALAQVTNLRGCVGFSLGVRTYSIGTTVHGTTASSEIPGDIDEVIKLCVPGTLAIPASAGAVSMTLSLYFRPGVTAGELGSVKFGQANASILPASLPTAP